MPAIVYCLPKTDEEREQSIAWNASNVDGTPAVVMVLPKLIAAENEQTLFRSIAPFAADVVAVALVSKTVGKSQIDLRQAIALSEHLPRTFVTSRITISPENFANRTCHVYGWRFSLTNDAAVSAIEVMALRANPDGVVRNMLQVARIAYVQQRRRRGEHWKRIAAATEVKCLIMIGPTELEKTRASLSPRHGYIGDLRTIPLVAEKPPTPLSQAPVVPPERHDPEPSRWERRKDIFG